MKLMGWAIALAAIGLTPAAASAQAPAAQPQVTSAAPAAATPTAATPAPSIDFVAPTPGIGVPDGRKGIQVQVTGGSAAANCSFNYLAATALGQAPTISTVVTTGC